MAKIHHHIKQFGRIATMWLVLFSLTPCTLKDGAFEAINIDYAQPLNKSKLPSLTNSCSYLEVSSKLGATIGKKSNADDELEPIDFSERPDPASAIGAAFLRFAKTTSGNSPPKYILYKRLKIGIA